MTLLSALNGRPRRAAVGTEAANKRLRSDKRMLEDQLALATAQWHQARAQADTSRRDITLLEKRLAEALQELADLKRKSFVVVPLGHPR